jgi:hypothetical protein
MWVSSACSLGAGVAAILGLMLRQQFPNLYCLCFSPPGCVFSAKIAKESQSYVCSYVLHNDIVPRLSYRSLVNLRSDLFEIISRVKVPKHEVFDSNYKRLDETSVKNVPDKLMHGKDEIPPSEFYSEFEKFKLRQEERHQESVIQQNIHMVRIIDLPLTYLSLTLSCTHIQSVYSNYSLPLMFYFHLQMAPGRILHMVRTSVKLGNVPCSCLLNCTRCIVCCGRSVETKKYKLRWISADELSEIYICK